MHVELGPDEIILGRVRGHLAPLMRRMLIGLFVVFFLFSNTLLLFRSGILGIIVFVLALSAVLTYLYQAYTVWDHTMLLITSERVIDIHQSHLWARHIDSLPYAKIKTASIAERKTFLDRFFRLGTVLVESTDADGFDLELMHVRRPSHVCDLILQAKQL